MGHPSTRDEIEYRRKGSPLDNTSPRTKCYAGGGTFRGGHCVFLRSGQGRTPYVSANRGPIHLISGIEKTQRSHPVPDFLRFLRGLGLGGTGFSS